MGKYAYQKAQAALRIANIIELSQLLCDSLFANSNGYTFFKKHKTFILRFTLQSMTHPENVYVDQIIDVSGVDLDGVTSNFWNKLFNLIVKSLKSGVGIVGFEEKTSLFRNEVEIHIDGQQIFHQPAGDIAQSTFSHSKIKIEVLPGKPPKVLKLKDF